MSKFAAPRAARGGGFRRFNVSDLALGGFAFGTRRRFFLVTN